MGVGLAIHGLLFRDIHFVTNDLLKLNNAINTCLTNPEMAYLY